MVVERALELLGEIDAELTELEGHIKRRPVRRSPPEGGFATVTLAEIYARQGFISKAMQILEDVVRKDPEQRGRAEVLMEKLRGIQDGVPFEPTKG